MKQISVAFFLKIDVILYYYAVCCCIC